MNPDGQMKLSDSVKLVGRCNDICPEFERVRRIDQKDYKRPECVRSAHHVGCWDADVGIDARNRTPRIWPSSTGRVADGEGVHSLFGWR